MTLINRAQASYSSAGFNLIGSDDLHIEQGLNSTTTCRDWKPPGPTLL